ncbi:MAG TPA: rhomboid family intramembrane serine protease [Prolixibacteraceae bacterium]|nr:rhomboid family intramembrane serine protease [Prolixibacteraceae bacterium]
MGIFSYYPHNSSKEDKDLEKKIFRHSLLFPAVFVALFWLVKLVEILLDTSFVNGGVFPRSMRGLTGILTSPFIHSGYAHLVSNSVPFFILLFALVYYYRKYSYRIFWQIFFISGICVWLGGREAWHIGASGVVYGLAAFHFTSGVIRNDLRLLTMSVVVVFLYGGMVWGMFPINPDISWESHLWGAISGVLLALYYRKYQIRREPYEWEKEPDEDEEDSGGELQADAPNESNLSEITTSGDAPVFAKSSYSSAIQTEPKENTADENGKRSEE